MATFRIKVMVDTEVEADSMDEAINEFCDEFDVWGEVDCVEIDE